MILRIRARSRVKPYMTKLPVALLFTITACGSGVRSHPMAGDDVDAAVDGSPDTATGTTVTEHEPNDERLDATQFPAGGGTFVVHGTCESSTDLDYYDVHSALGPYSIRFEWQAGAFEMMFDPEDGMSGSQSKSTVSPVVVSGSVTTTPAQFAIDCYNDGNPSGLTGLAYTLYVTLP